MPLPLLSHNLIIHSHTHIAQICACVNWKNHAELLGYMSTFASLFKACWDLSLVIGLEAKGGAGVDSEKNQQDPARTFLRGGHDSIKQGYTGYSGKVGLTWSDKGGRTASPLTRGSPEFRGFSVPSFNKIFLYVPIQFTGSHSLPIKPPTLIVDTLQGQ